MTDNRTLIDMLIELDHAEDDYREKAVIRKGWETIAENEEYEMVGPTMSTSDNLDAAKKNELNASIKVSKLRHEVKRKAEEGVV